MEQELEPQAQVKLPQPQKFYSLDPPQEFESQAPRELPQESQEFDPIDLPEESETKGQVDPPQESPPRSNTGAKIAHKLLEQWYKESGKHNNEATVAVAQPFGPPRLGLEETSKEPRDDEDEDDFDPFYGLGNLSSRMAEFDPSDLSQYAERYVAATRPAEPEPLNVTQNYVIVKTYTTDDEED